MRAGGEEGCAGAAVPAHERGAVRGPHGPAGSDILRGGGRLQQRHGGAGPQPTEQRVAAAARHGPLPPRAPLCCVCCALNFDTVLALNIEEVLLAAEEMLPKQAREVAEVK